jgi:lipid A 3-O-deacylase
LNRFTSLLLSGLFLAPFALRGADEAPAVANHTARLTGTVTLYFENDWFGGTDRHYTNGCKFSWLSSDLATWGDQGWRQTFVKMLPFMNRPESQKNLGLGLGQNIYTPRDQDIFVPDPADRPYAGWSYLEFTFLSKTEDIADAVVIQLGLVGRHSYAQDVQREVHRWTDDGRPNGWEHQFHDEVGLNLIAERKWRLFGRSIGETFGVDLVPHAGLCLGNVQTHANVGGTVRLGVNLPSDFGVDLIRGGGGASSPLDDRDPRVAADRSWSVFIFGGADGRAVARDIFLDGNTFRDSPGVDKRTFVVDLSYGVGLIAGRWQLTFTQVSRTREFEAQLHKYNEFGSLTLSRSF